MGAAVALLSSEIDMRSPCGRLRTNIEVVIKPQLHMRSLAIRNGPPLNSNGVTCLSSFSSSISATKAGNSHTRKEQQTGPGEENDWLKRARYSGCRNDRAKPPYSYASLIAQAILASRVRKLTLGEIYQWIMDTYPYYQSENSGWQNSIRHNLSLNRCFVKLDKSCGGMISSSGSKGSYWGIDETLMGELNDDGLFKRRKHRTEKKRHLSFQKIGGRSRKSGKPLGDITNVANAVGNCLNESLNVTDVEACEENEMEGSLLLEFFNDQENVLGSGRESRSTATPLPTSSLCSSLLKPQQRHQILGCPELTEENFTIPTQVTFSSEFY
jgi:hypothetical protein